MTSTFVNTSFSSDICRVALPILANGPAGEHVMGTAVMITPGLALTARHVIDECLSLHDRVPPGVPGSQESLHAGFTLTLVQFTDRGRSGLLWKGRRVHTSAFTDIAFIELLRPPETTAQPSVVMTTVPPRPGERVFAFGYPRSRIVGQTITLDPRTTSGQVLEVYEHGRDRSILPHPCFHTNAVFDAGMSGGPVFNQTGQLCGIISTSMCPDAGNPEWASFASLLWPAFGTRLYMQRADVPVPHDGYHAIELVRAGFLSLVGGDRIVIHDGDRPDLA